MEFLDNLRNIIFIDANNLSLVGKIIYIGLVILVTWLIVRIIHSLIFNRLKLPDQVVESKVDTMKSLIYNIVKIVAIFVAAMTILETVGINTGSLIATAGIGGVAIGFGAQYIVRDYISGMVIIAEDQYRVGELVVIEGFEGYVEEVGLRLTKLRAFNGNLHIIQNGNIEAVTNQSRGPQRVWTEIYVSKSTSTAKVEKALVSATEIINEKYDEIIEPIKYLGITNMTEFDAVYLLKGMVEPGFQWKIDREVRKIAMEELRKEGVRTDNYSLDQKINPKADMRENSEDDNKDQV